MGNTGAHCCTVTNSPAFANQIEATESGQRRWLDSHTRKLNKHRNKDLQISLCHLLVYCTVFTLSTHRFHMPRLDFWNKVPLKIQSDQKVT